MSSPDHLPADVVINAPAIDYFDSSGSLYETPEVDAADVEEFEVPEARVVYQAMDEIIRLKQARDGSSSAIDVSHPDQLAGLRADRQAALRLMDRLTDDIGQQFPDTMVAHYGFADIAGLSDHPAAASYRGKVGETPLIMRAEESLAPRANQLIDTIINKQRHELRTDRWIDDETVYRVNEHGEVSETKLRGYVYNRSADKPEERQSFERFPSCEALMAAGVLDQLQEGASLVRIIPASMKNREYATKYLLDMAGYQDLNVLSAVVSEDGGVQSIIPWGAPKKGEATVENLRPLLLQHKAHATSNRLSEALHNDIFAMHREAYETYNHPELAANTPPGNLLDNELVSDRIHEFFSRTWRAAPVYEARRLHGDNAEIAIKDVIAAASLFEQVYQAGDASLAAYQPEIEHFEGAGSNEVLYSRIVLAARREPDAALAGQSDEVCLVGHFLHEQPSQQLMASIKEPGDITNIRRILQDHPPRYVLLEGRRVSYDELTETEALDQDQPI